MSDWQASNVASTFAKVFYSLVETGDKALSELETFSEVDKKQVEAWNSRQPQSLNGCVHAVFETQVLAQPDAQAICAWDGDFTYRKLDELSTRLAYHLMGLGVGPEVIVPLCFKKSAWTIIAMLAVLKAGGACVSLDDLHPLSRLEAIISDVDATLILASPATEALSVLLAKDVLIVDQFLMDNLPIAGSAADTAAVGNHVQPSNSAFVIYTSGSTGTPKGVVLEHRSVCTSVEAHGSVLQIGPGSRVLQFAAYVFDISIQDIFTTLMRGGCICVLSEQERMNDLAGAINRMDVNFACITPTVAGLLRPSDVPTLKTLTLAGEAVTKKVIDIWSGLASLNNCYGPAESTIYCAWNGRVGQTGIPSNIGHGLASLLWVVDVTDHNRLAPVGCIGELLLEGPLLARGYLNDTAKTTSSFVDYPAWIKDSRANQSGRMYKTGDLVRYNSDGTLDYLGRKDTQVKLHGQRLELGEVEHHLLGAKSVSNAMVMLPKMGHCQGRLVAITELWGDEAPAGSALDSTKGSTRGSEIQLLDKAQVGVMSLRTSQLREYLSNQLPTYMLPTVWILVEAIPLNTSGKLDRAKVAQWVQEMDDETYQRIADFQLEEMAGPTTAIDRRLQALLSRVLNVPAEFVALSKSFLSLGGDSITAMQVVSRGRAEGITLRVQDILQSQTISQLALVVKTNGTLSLAREDEVETVFDLSPIQQLYFGMAGDRANQFNQSFFLRLTREIRAQDMARTIEALVRQHSMLRARFSRRASDGRWGQRITKDVSESYRFRLHEIKQKGEMTAILASSQTSLDVENGPVFTADMFNVAGEGQLLFLVAHHLVIDLVSWRVVLHDFEEILESGTLSAEKPFPFQAWCKLQAEYSQQLLPGKVLPVPILPADYAYWGMTNRPNVYGDVIGDSFIINAEVTSRLLGSCHEALGTEPAEVFLATLLHAFSQTFDDRATPTVFSEGHGREPWDAEIDLSETVGWFTTMSPLHVAVESGASVVDAVRRTKDTRRKLPSNGWPYFASKYLNSEGIKAFADHMPMEMLFNYLGRYQQLERKDSLVRQEPLPDGSSAMDVACDVQRLALFEISVMVVHDVAQFRVVYNRHMHRQTDISRWMGAWEQSLLEAAQQLSNMEAERTLSDFPLLPLTYSSLTKLKYEQLDRGVTSFANVEDVYPCSPMQQGLLLSQTRNSGSYEVDFMFEVVPSKFPVVLERLLAAWQQVVNRHAALRTTFVKSVTKDGVFDQIVYKRITARTMVRQCTDDDTKILAVLKDQKPIDDKDNGALHRLTVCQTAFGRVLCKLEISHAVIDAASIGIMYREMSLAYEGKLPSSAGPLYSEYIRYIQERPIQLSLDYWKQHLHNIEPCNFPLLPEKTVEVNELRSTKVDFDLPSGALRRFCERTGVTVANVTQTVWGLVLRCYTGSDQVCFGYLASGRDAAVDGIEDAVGPFINMLVCRMDVVGSSLVGELVEHVQENYLASLDYQHCSLAQIQHGLKLSGQPLFNTLMSVQRLSKTPVLGNANADLPAISFQSIGSNDPTEVSDVIQVKQHCANRVI
jgi:amino acid adenylation domain-containing protein/non-ribosomal peptide synthase protein (TIGR01720 family)